MKRIAFVVVVLALMLFGSSARAGQVTVERNDGALSPSDVTLLATEGARWPFSLHVLVGDYGRRGELARAAHGCVSSPDAVCVAIDPGHHATESRFGTHTGVRPTDFEIVAASGNARFKQGDWRGGIEASADRARESGVSASTPTFVVQPLQAVPVAGAPAESHWFLWSVVVALAAAALFVAWRVRRRQREAEEDMERLREERLDAEKRWAEEKEWHDSFRARVGDAPSTPPPPAGPRPRRSGARAVAPAAVSSSTVVVNQVPAYAGRGGGNGAADVLLGFELGRDLSAPREREVVRERARSEPDAGGASSSWSPSSDTPSFDSGSSSDSGGGGSSWSSNGSGGGGSSFDDSSSSSSYVDSGGGGFDSGGGSDSDG